VKSEKASLIDATKPIKANQLLIAGGLKVECAIIGSKAFFLQMYEREPLHKSDFHCKLWSPRMYPQIGFDAE
jgi:hypothetical protein